MNRFDLVKKLILFGVLIAAVGAPLAVSSIFWSSVLTLVLINSLMAASLRTILLIGEFSLGHVGFMCLGAYSSALLTMHYDIPFGLALLASGMIAALVAVVIGFPYMRVKAIYFVILTVVTSESIRLVAYNWKSVTGGNLGLIGFPGAGVFEIPGLLEVDFNGFTEYYYLTLAVVCLSLLILYRLEKSKLGFVWRSIRDSNKLSGAVGINVLRYKVICFSIACFFAGIAGSLMAHFEQALSAMDASAFGIMTTLYLFIYVVVGGKNRFSGPLVGTVVLSFVLELSRPIQNFQPMLIGVICIVVVMNLPEGLVSIPDYIRLRMNQKKEPETLKLSILNKEI